MTMPVDNSPLRPAQRAVLIGGPLGGLAATGAAAQTIPSAPVAGPIKAARGTPLTRYDKRFSESMGETQANPPEHPTPQQAWDARKVTVPLKVGWLQPTDISPAAVFLASDAAAMVTGAEFEVTAGDSAHDI